MSDAQNTAPAKGNGSLALLWVIALVAIVSGLITLASSEAVGAAWGLFGFGGVAILLALTVQAVRNN